MSEREAAERERYDDDNILIDADEDRFAWRRKIKSNPTTRVAYRVGVGVIGLAIVIVGIIALPLPGPGWLIIFVGIGVWASEFEWAAKLLDWVKVRVQAWTAWVGRQNWFVRGLVGLGILVLVLAVFYAMFAVSGVPGFFPEFAKDWLGNLPGL
ncbi:TIGR02611 family protein [Flexivirga sp. B27]